MEILRALGKRTHGLFKHTHLDPEYKNINEVITKFQNNENIIDVLKMCDIMSVIGQKQNVYQGGFGAVSVLNHPVYNENGKDYPIVMKRLLEEIDENTLNEHHEYIVEILVSSVLTRAYYLNECMHFGRIFSAFLCNGIGYMFLERYAGPIDNFEEIVGRKISDIDVKYIFVQILSSLIWAQDKYVFMHRDLHPNNILIHKLTKNDIFDNKPLIDAKSFAYKINGDVYIVPNLGYIIKIIDFGYSQLRLGDKMIVSDDVLSKKYHRTPERGNFDVEFSPSLDILFLIRSIIMLSRFYPAYRQFIKTPEFEIVACEIFNKQTGYLNGDWQMTPILEHLYQRPIGKLPDIDLTKTIQTFGRAFLSDVLVTKDMQWDNNKPFEIKILQ